MQITLTRSGDYAVRAVIAIARHGAEGDGLMKGREIAEEMDIPVGYSAQLLASLVRARLLNATAGPNGGYELAVPAAELTLLDVIRAIEGPLERERCVMRGGPCDWVAVCPLHSTWHDIETLVLDRLTSTTFDELGAMDAAIEMGAAPIPQDSHGRSVPRLGQRPPGQHAQDSDPGKDSL